MLTRNITRILNIITKIKSNAKQVHQCTAESLNKAYKNQKALFKSKKLPPDVNVEGVFACNELDLNEVDIYGFDYDYTMVMYKPSLQFLLYNLGSQILIEKHKYPTDILQLKYIPDFAIRGLHYDIQKGLLLKLDSFLQIQLDSVYRGLTPLTREEILKLYKKKMIPIGYVEGRGKRKSSMIQLADLFSVPAIVLLCNVTDYFEKNRIDYHAENIFRDVKDSLVRAHVQMHEIVPKNVKLYLEPNFKLRLFFERLKTSNKKLFIVTNSPYHFVNNGMDYIVGKDWKSFFDVIIVQARKPKFFTDKSRPIRIYDDIRGLRIWDRVTKLEKGTIYYEGTVKQFENLTNWRGNKVLYFGDHPYSDLADVILAHGWRTGAIVPELTHEIQTLNLTSFKEHANWLHMLMQIIEDYQDCEGSAKEEILSQWTKERDELRVKMKKAFNAQFGSVFRTYHNPSYFSRRLFRFADIYTSSVTNLLNYSVKHTFYPRRGVMPHEYTSYFV